MFRPASFCNRIARGRSSEEEPVEVVDDRPNSLTTSVRWMRMGKPVTGVNEGKCANAGDSSFLRKERGVRILKKETKTYDAIVVGSGPGGGTVARELSRKGRKVLLLERGRDPIPKGSMLQTLPTFRPFKTTGKTTIMTQSVAGGATFSYCAVALDPPYDVFESYGIDLREDVAETKNELGVAPLPDRLIGPMSRRIMASAQESGLDWQKMPKFIDPSKCLPGCWRCAYNCPYGAKWTAREFAVQTIDNGGDFVTNANVEEVVIENGKATGVVYASNAGTARAEAPLVVLSAGGMYSPKLLEKASIEGVGRDFFFDPLLVLTGVVKGAKGGLREIPMSAGIDFPEEGYLLTDFTPTALRYLGSALAAGKLNRMFSGRSALSILIKIRDELSGYLPEKGLVNKELGEIEKKRFGDGIEIAEKVLRRAGARSIFKTSIVGSHPGGTVKIGECVDRNLKTEIDNLYVCDASVIPISWGLPPVLTLISLGKRLARHLCSQRG
jgi:choline dehydrogenase-like flavoprotein